MSCPAPESLIPFVSGKHDDAVARHVHECPICQSEVARLREATAELRADAAGKAFRRTPDCLDELTLAQLVDGSAAVEARRAALAHLAVCARCRHEVTAINAMRRAIASRPGDG